MKPINIDKLFAEGVVPVLCDDVTEEEKKILLEETIKCVGKPLLYTWYMLECKTHLECSFFNEPTKEMFLLTIKKMNRLNEGTPIDQEFMFRDIIEGWIKFDGTGNEYAKKLTSKYRISEL